MALSDMQRKEDSWWWLSFAEPFLEKGSQFLGVLIISVPAGSDPVTESHMRKLNPGGQVAMQEIPLSEIGHVPEGMRNKLLSRSEAESLND